MEFIMNKGFISRFVENLSKNEDIEEWEDFKHFLKKRLKGFDLITDFSQIELNSPSTFEQYPALRWLYENADKTSSDENILRELNEKSFYEKGSVFKLICIDEETHICKRHSDNFGYSFLNINNLSELWKPFSRDNKYNDIPIDNNFFDNWSKIEYLQHPVRSMVIIDFYLFFEKDEKGNIRGCIENNLLTFLSHFLTNSTKEIELLIITDTRNIKLKETFPADNEVYFVKNKLQTYLNRKFPDISFTLDILNYDKRVQTEMKEHDRYVFTNLGIMSFSGGLNIFKESGKIFHRGDLGFNFIFDEKGRKKAFSGLKNLQDYIRRKRNGYTGNKLIDSMVNY